MTRLLVAAGGGGDALAASIVHGASTPDVSELHRRVADLEHKARDPGADYVTLRRLAEALDLSPTDRAQLLRARPDQPTPSLWSVKSRLR